MQKGVELFSEKGFSVPMLTPSVSRASMCAVLTLCHRATFSCALHTKELFCQMIHGLPAEQDL